MIYNLTDTQSYDIAQLQKELDAAGVPNNGVSGNGPKQFTVHVDSADEPAADAVVQNHLLTDWDAWRTSQAAKKVYIDQLADSDRGMARIGEDLITALINKNIISIKDLPQFAQNKLNERIALRSKL